MKFISILNVVIKSAVVAFASFILFFVLAVFFFPYLGLDGWLIFTVSGLSCLLISMIFMIITREGYEVVSEIIFYASIGIIILIICLSVLMPGIGTSRDDICFMATNNSLQDLSEATLVYVQEFKKFPTGENYPEALLALREKGHSGFRLEKTDGWKRPFRYGLLDKGHFAIISAGKDGIFGTEDDLIAINDDVYLGDRLKKADLNEKWENKLTSILAGN